MSVTKDDAANAFDISNICRACLAEKDDMQSVFDDIDGDTLAEMLMEFASVQIEMDDCRPGLLCADCARQTRQCLAFKQQCEQSDKNLRQYLGKPTKVKANNAPKLHKNCLLPLLEPYEVEVTIDEDPNDGYDEDQTTSNSRLTNDAKVIAQKQLTKSSKLQTKRKASQASVQNEYQCEVCKKTMANVKLFRRHLRTHIEDRPFKCTLCSRRFTEEIYLNNHMRAHIPHEEKPHECDFCDRRFMHITQLKKHIMKHTGEKPFVCKICNKGCYAENSLLKHMKIHERKQGDPALLKHVCDYCRREFASAELLAEHIKQHSGDKPFLCTRCGKCFPQRFNLELHLRTHTGERPFTCEICKNGYVSKASLKIHMRTHTNERPFVCDFCGKAFRQSGDLTSHKRLHGTEKPIECTICHKRFTTAMKLKYHMRNHTGERPYVCAVCGRGFTVNTILLRHMRVHSGERPYVCVTCGKAFSQSSTLNTHMKVHAEPPLEPPDEQEQHMQMVHLHRNHLQQMFDLADFKITASSSSSSSGEEDSRLLRLLEDTAAMRLIGGATMTIAVADNTHRVLNDKYLNGYDPYRRGHV